MSKHEITRDNGKEVTVTIPPNTDPVQDWFEDMQDILSPEAVATILAHIYSVNLKTKIRDDAVQQAMIEQTQKQVIWFRDKLMEKLGVKQYNEILEELHL